MPKPIMHYEYLAADRIRNLYQQIHKGWFRRVPLQLSLSLLQLGQIVLGKPAENEPSLPEQLEAVLAYLEKHQPEKIGAIDEPRMYIKGVLPMFTHAIPQGFGVEPTDTPEFIYYGGSTESMILGLAGPIANLVGEPPAGDSMRPLSSALPNLVKVLAKHYRVQTRFAGDRYDEKLALACIEYMEIYNRTGIQLRNYSFLATVKLDTQKIPRRHQTKRIILASPIYMAYAN